MKRVIGSEAQALERIAAQYRGDGYTVIVQPVGDSLPDFLSGFRPDLIVERGDEHIVVEVKDSRSLRNSPELVRLAERVNEQPGWKVDLVATHLIEYDQRLRWERSQQPLLESDQLLDSAKLLLKEADSSSAFILAWMRAEVALRHIARAADVQISRAPRVALHEMVMQGLLKRADYNFLLRSYALRSEVVHGMRPKRNLTRATEAVLNRVTKLLADSERAQSNQ